MAIRQQFSLILQDKNRTDDYSESFKTKKTSSVLTEGTIFHSHSAADLLSLAFIVFQNLLGHFEVIVADCFSAVAGSTSLLRFTWMNSGHIQRLVPMINFDGVGFICADFFFFLSLWNSVRCHLGFTRENAKNESDSSVDQQFNLQPVARSAHHRHYLIGFELMISNLFEERA